MLDTSAAAILNAAPPGARCYECMAVAVTLCPWPVHQRGEKQATACGRYTCPRHSHIIVDSLGKGRLPGICLEHRNVVLEARAHREEVMAHRCAFTKTEDPDAAR